MENKDKIGCGKIAMQVWNHTEYIDIKCDDGRFGFVTLEEWSEIHEGCYDYKYYYKCIGIEKEEEYIKIAEARIKPFKEQMKLTLLE